MEMENSEPLSIDSFSHSWLINPGPFEIPESCCSMRSSIDEGEGPSSFIEMDPRLPASKRFKGDLPNLNFHFPNSGSPVSLVHADDLFRNGRLLPHYTCPSKMVASQDDEFDVNPPAVYSAITCKDVIPSSPNRCPSLRRSWTVSKNVLHRYLSCLHPLYRRVCRRGASSKVAENWMDSPQNFPWTSVGYSNSDQWRTSCGSESSIDEAVLHCKRSFSK